MRALALLFAGSVALGACGGNADFRQPPKQLRACGELEGVESVEPVVVGADFLGCPVFAPVPCTKDAAEYDSLCGSDCSPAIGTKADGDAWLLGCETRGPAVVCGGPDFRETYCGIDPFEGVPYWWGVNECDPFFLYFLDCWESCDESRSPIRNACL